MSGYTPISPVTVNYTGPTAAAIGTAVAAPSATAIATGVYNQGARIVDNPVNLNFADLVTPNGGGTGVESGTKDVNDGITLLVTWAWSNTNGARTSGAAKTNSTLATLTVRWYSDLAKSFQLGTEIFEVGGQADLTTWNSSLFPLISNKAYVRIPIIGSAVTLQLSSNGTAGTVPDTTVGLAAFKSFRPENVSRFIGDGGGDHVLSLNRETGIAAGANSHFYCSEPYNGPGEIHIYAPVKGSFRMGWGSSGMTAPLALNANFTDIYTTPTGGAFATPLPPLRNFPRRPLVWQFSNTDTLSSGATAVQVWVVATQFA